ncbi:AAA family ATPase [Pseudomonas syringae]|uniref:AAA family ATPase n=1 Tax=Pseudomonas syringae TaxID=317 RepID=UPI003204F1B6
MDKKVMFAVAGSGKTSEIIRRLAENKRAIIITYTENNFNHLRSKVIGKFGYMPKHITVMTYFSFLHSFCYRPLLQQKMKTKGLYLKLPSDKVTRARDKMSHYLHPSGRLYYNRLAKFLDETKSHPEVIRRLERFYDQLFVDEVQDFAANDFNLLMALSPVKADILFVGDFYQHTFDTSRDGNINCNLHNNIEKYEKRFRDSGYFVDKKTLKNSWRCGTTVCDFIRANLKIEIFPVKERHTAIIKIEDQVQADVIHRDNNIVKLFYNTHHRYECHSNNWGACKGLDHYKDVCIILSKSQWQQYQNGQLHKMKPRTKNKLYVACTRAYGKVYFAPEHLFAAHKKS